MGLRCLFGSIGTYGMLGPMIGVAQVLRARGHAVAFVTSMGMGPLLQRYDLRRIPRGEGDGPSFESDVIGHPLETLRQVQHLEYAVESFRPDVLVGQPMAFGPLVSARRHGLPVAVLGLAAYLLPVAGMPDSEYTVMVKRRHEALVKAYRAGAGLAGDASADAADLLGDLFLVQSVPELEGEVPADVQLVGSCLWDPPSCDPELADWLADARQSGRPVIYLALGRAYGATAFWTHLADALGGMPVAVAGAIGRSDTPVDGVPGNFFLRDHISQSAVLAHADLAITFGTTTAVLGALTHGVPLLLAAGNAGEQMDLAVRCLRAGVGRHISPHTATVALIRDQVRALLGNGEMREKARCMQRAFARGGGQGRVADLLEELGRRSTRRTITRRSPGRDPEEHQSG